MIECKVDPVRRRFASVMSNSMQGSQSLESQNGYHHWLASRREHRVAASARLFSGWHN